MRFNESLGGAVYVCDGGMKKEEGVTHLSEVLVGRLRHITLAHNAVDVVVQWERASVAVAVGPAPGHQTRESCRHQRQVRSGQVRSGQVRSGRR